ncbi:probable serine/threonine-protein kinase DDB_G0278509 [Octopus bimaculoides]|uniref:Disease resistance R13L4/SHOC-2-like LRR domain-containing protein n=1 Tax=Octopus bimaculoides TaxID=37653 RepID=A0A0L8GFD3_OCTBM|nr:probable serine/threonine-protein kinase DDB_G0278509 [Octopus bimaculoides]|eukprot:XP_014781581.1 PREDICTED: probable serine/threonine-protein kinase DDB_G0278509 [Octopus bimaculoides]
MMDSDSSRAGIESACRSHRTKKKKKKGSAGKSPSTKGSTLDDYSPKDRNIDNKTTLNPLMDTSNNVELGTNSSDCKDTLNNIDTDSKNQMMGSAPINTLNNIDTGINVSESGLTLAKDSWITKTDSPIEKKKQNLNSPQSNLDKVEIEVNNSDSCPTFHSSSLIEEADGNVNLRNLGSTGIESDNMGCAESSNPHELGVPVASHPFGNSNIGMELPYTERLVENIEGAQQFTLFRQLTSMGKLEDIILRNSVRVLKLVSCHLRSLPEDLGNLLYLEALVCSENQLTELPQSVGYLQHLKLLQVDMNRLKQLPANIGSLKSLKLLAANDNQLEYLPASISVLENLQTLDLSNNCLRSLPLHFQSSACLNQLYIQKNSIEKLPPWIAKMSKIQEFQVGENLLTEWPDFEEFGRTATQLMVLDVSENRLSDLANGFGGLQSLSCLNLGRNPFVDNQNAESVGNLLKGLPNSFCQLHAVTLLSIDGNCLQNLPNNFGDLRSLKMLNLCDNQLEWLPDSFCYLNSLQLCLLSRNSLNCLPEHFGHLPALKHLEVSHNNLVDLPSTFGKLSAQLVYLDLCNNCILHELKILEIFERLTYLDVGSNPFVQCDLSSTSHTVNPQLTTACNHYFTTSLAGQFEDFDGDEEGRDEGKNRDDDDDEDEDKKGEVYSQITYQQGGKDTLPSRNNHQSAPQNSPCGCIYSTIDSSFVGSTESCSDPLKSSMTLTQQLKGNIRGSGDGTKQDHVAAEIHRMPFCHQCHCDNSVNTDHHHSNHTNKGNMSEVKRKEEEDWDKEQSGASKGTTACRDHTMNITMTNNTVKHNSSCRQRTMTTTSAALSRGHIFLPADIHKENINYNFVGFRKFTGQFDNADE